MAQQCERTGCQQPTAVEYSINSGKLLLTLENYRIVEGERRSAVCSRHADLMSMPKGWSIDDRRENPPRLFRTPQPAVDSVVKIEKSPTKSKSKKNPAVRPMLFQGEKSDAKVVEVTAANPIVRDADLEETQALPWVPQFDRTDDLGGVLRPKGKLLSRAFGLDETIDYPRPVLDDGHNGHS